MRRRERAAAARYSETGRFLRRKGNLRVRRERRQQTISRALGRVAAGAAVLGLAAAVVGGTAHWLMTTPALAVTDILVVGAKHADVGALRALASGALSQNLLALELRPLAAGVQGHRWVREVVIRKQLPDTLVVEVKERSPCATAILGGEAFLIDTTGEPIDQYGPRYAAWSFPVLRGLDGLDETERRRRCRQASEQIQALRAAYPDLYARLAEVDLANPDAPVLLVEGIPERLRVAPADWTRNLRAYRTLRTALVGRHGALSYVDLRWAGRLAVMQEN